MVAMSSASRDARSLNAFDRTRPEALRFLDDFPDIFKHTGSIEKSSSKLHSINGKSDSGETASNKATRSKEPFAGSALEVRCRLVARSRASVAGPCRAVEAIMVWLGWWESENSLG